MNWDELMDEIEIQVTPYTLPYEVGSDRGAEVRHEVEVLTKHVTVDHDPGEDLPSRTTLRKEILAGGRFYEVVVTLELVVAARTEDGRAIRSIYRVEPWGVSEEPPVVMLGPGKGYRTAPLGGNVDIVV
jgi:hypothetical protein